MFSGKLRVPQWLRVVAGVIVGMVLSGRLAQIMLSLLAGVALGALGMWLAQRWRARSPVGAPRLPRGKPVPAGVLDDGRPNRARQRVDHRADRPGRHRRSVAFPDLFMRGVRSAAHR
jgi:hypothetical protein